jgi:lysine-specific demethylase/histidyl-hydroxylase NO66
MLRKGDVLYLPRGWVHQAEAPLGVTDDDGASLHLSLGLEVEPLTDWAGAMHIALRQHVLRSANGHTYSTQKGCQTEKLSLLVRAPLSFSYFSKLSNSVA